MLLQNSYHLVLAVVENVEMRCLILSLSWWCRCVRGVLFRMSHGLFVRPILSFMITTGAHSHEYSF